jgi:hypothetical protein
VGERQGFAASKPDAVIEWLAHTAFQWLQHLPHKYDDDVPCYKNMPSTAEARNGMPRARKECAHLLAHLLKALEMTCVPTGPGCHIPSLQHA